MLHRADEDHQQSGLIRGINTLWMANEGKTLPQDQNQTKQLIINFIHKTKLRKIF